MVSALDKVSHIVASSLYFSDQIKIMDIHKKMISLSNTSQYLSKINLTSCEHDILSKLLSNLSSCDNLSLPQLEFALLVMSLECFQLPTSKSNECTSKYLSDQSVNDFSSLAHSSLKCVRNLEKYCVQLLLSKEELLQTLERIQIMYPHLYVFENKYSNTKVVVAHTGFNNHIIHSDRISILVASQIGFQSYLANNLSSLVNELCSFEIHCSNEILPKDTSIANKLVTNIESKTSHLVRIPAYDFNGCAISGNESVDTFFLTDGVIARSQVYSIAEGSDSVVVSLIDNHTVISSSLQWNKINTEVTSASSVEHDIMISLPSKLCSGELHASFDDDIFISLSRFGPKTNGKVPYLPAKPKILEESYEPSSIGLSGQPSSSPQKMSKKQQEQYALEQQRLLEIQISKQKQFSDQQYQADCERFILNNKVQQLFVTTRKGLHISFQILHDFGHSSAAIATYQENISVGQMDCCEVFQKERRRCYLPNGTIISFLKNGAIVIRCSDGTIFETASKYYEDIFNKQESTEIVANKFNAVALEEFTPNFLRKKTLWLVTTPLGTQYLWKEECDCRNNLNVKKEEEVSISLPTEATPPKAKFLFLEPLKIFKTSDPFSKEVH